MATLKELQKFSQYMSILYVEDNENVGRETHKMLQLLFARVEWVRDGVEGLQMYNQNLYDLVITDINMPRMNGVEMMGKIHEINPEQKIVAISAHDEPEILITVMRKGVNSFLLKPINLDEMITVLYPVCRDASAQRINEELFDALNQERDKLKKMVTQLAAQTHTIEVKNEQLGTLSAPIAHQTQEVLQEYFAKDEDQGNESVLFLEDDSEEMVDLLDEIPDQLTLYVQDADASRIERVGDDVAKIANLLFRYTPFMDPLAKSMESLAHTIKADERFVAMVQSKPEHMLALVDAVCIDLGLYVKRFAVESMAMRNIHHIHQPTTLSIEQIIQMIAPSNDSVDEGGEIELF
ncbi:MAG: hypothetical protein KU37_11710 [Sulfuricurvum sp. PC08-66]|nr:MAG: hypothetical protein KU37_11710 [Sulfuricurvum sp. PC08-66]